MSQGGLEAKDVCFSGNHIWENLWEEHGSEKQILIWRVQASLVAQSKESTNNSGAIGDTGSVPG